MLLVLNVVYNHIILAQAARDLHRSRTWASNWLKRYDKEGLEGLGIEQKVVDHPKYQKRQVTRLRKS